MAIDLNDYLEKLEEPEDREAVANREYQKELFEEYVVRGTDRLEEREQLLHEYQQGAALTGEKGLRKKLGAFDLEYFGRAYLPHYFVRESPEFHGELDRIWAEGVLKKEYHRERVGASFARRRLGQPCRGGRVRAQFE